MKVDKVDLRELDKLENWLKENGIEYERIDKEFDFGFCRHQIIVPKKGEEREWDAICQYGSYGVDSGLLEIYGTIVPDFYGDEVVGYLTADEVVRYYLEKKGSE